MPRVSVFAGALAAGAFPPATEIVEMARQTCEIDHKGRFAITEKTISLAECILVLFIHALCPLSSVGYRVLGVGPSMPTPAQGRIWQTNVHISAVAKRSVTC